ncbi:MAG TPA: DUF1844 domain-containing protein [Polyangiaceae bacterium LLY-WYZ-15_(1-7)]|nr:hypothetical protein [Myxococcales bacterium]MAT23501.1 hypothetical protein [Sandaracinus sp.]HJK92211.1 DUF1844 domain-containing protein [Polyangiaceae bacterium LLY-WYZ-15_(1-7)]MBJ73231.1 hypothetical protein [Sandaracinus sp.]HJL02683.1 DUF1844 domain-containing protein [Polyangiaceae bacterium LLY-WYZ-15_(1-7)]
MGDDALTPEEKAEAERRADEVEEKQTTQAPPVDFNTFVLSLSSTALVHLGAAPPELFPDGQMPPRNLPMAKQSIDLIAMIEEKTQGNLSGEEERLLQQVLYDLRMRYVQAAG